VNIYNRYTTQDFQYAHQVMTADWDFTDYDDFMTKHGPKTKTRDYALFAMMAIYYEGSGVIVEQDLIELNLVDTLLHNNIQRFWLKMEPVILEYRKRRGTPYGAVMDYPLFDSLERLYQSTQQIGQQITINA